MSGHRKIFQSQTLRRPIYDCPLSSLGTNQGCCSSTKLLQHKKRDSEVWLWPIQWLIKLAVLNYAHPLRMATLVSDNSLLIKLFSLYTV